MPSATCDSAPSCIEFRAIRRSDGERNVRTWCCTTDNDRRSNDEQEDRRTLNSAHPARSGVEFGLDCRDGERLPAGSTIAFSSRRDHVNDDPALTPALLGAEVYLMGPDMTNPRRLTDNSAFDGFAALSPDGKKMVFDSTRLTGCPECAYPGTIDRSDLFLMNTDGTEQTYLIHGSSATWSPDSKADRLLRLGVRRWGAESPR